MSPPPNMDSSIAENAGWEEETAGSWADVESPQLCGNSREWLWYLFLLPKEVGIYESHHKHIPRAQANFRPSALIQSDEIAGVDLWWSLEGNLSHLASLIQVLS